MYTKVILLLTILSYSIVAAQSFMYMIALKNVQQKMAAPSYIELRKLLDAGFRANFKYVVYAALITNLVLVFCTVNKTGSLLFITATISFVAMVTDVLLMMKGNMPINNLINTWTAENYPVNWADYRTKWLQIFKYRQIANITGFVSLLIGAVFGNK